MKSPEVMSFRVFNKPFSVHCDASKIKLGAALYQELEGQIKVISYASRTL